MARRRYWLLKSEPAKYSWDQMVRDGRTYWEGVRNHQARNYLQDMSIDDRACFYHSQEGKEIVGVVRVARAAYPDPTSDDPRWVVVDVEPVAPLREPVTLATIRADPELEGIALVRQSRLSVMPIETAHFRYILRLGKTRL